MRSPEIAEALAMFSAKNKSELIIEVWEKLDCESVGAVEIESIEKVVKERFGDAAVDSPMVIARLLADEGAELRHSEIMKLYLDRASDRPYDAALTNLFDTSQLSRLRTSLKNAENLRRKLLKENDKAGLRLLRQTAIDAKKLSSEGAKDKRLSDEQRAANAEAVEWITLWLQSPELFETWIKMRISTKEFKERFSDLK
ncbi:MAG: hypothetical protein ACJ72Z_14360 [Pyrinomonadaceae bacterium]